MTNKEKTTLQKEVISSLNKNPHGRLLLAPRVGKTKLIIDLIKRDKPDSILWVTPSAKLAEEDIPKEFEIWGAKEYIKKLTTITYTSLHKVKGFYNLIVLDEDQFVTENNLINLLNGSLKWGNIISMTGTPTKHFEKILLYNRLKLKPLYKISINTAVDIGLLSNYSVKVVQVEMDTRRNLKVGTKKKPFYTSEVLNYDYLSRMVQKSIEQRRKDIQFRILNRVRAIKNSHSKLEAAKFLVNNLKDRKLIFSASINQAQYLCKHTYHSKTNDKDLKAFQEEKIDCIAMVNAGGTGFTYKKIDHLIVVQADSDKTGMTSQKIARALLSQKNYKASVWIISLMGTQDVKWVNSTLENFDKSKIEYIKFKNLKKWKIIT